MRILKGFEALEYVLNNKDAILYSRKRLTLQYHFALKIADILDDAYGSLSPQEFDKLLEDIKETIENYE